MSRSEFLREPTEAERETKRAAAQRRKLEAALAAYADGVADLAQLLPGRAARPRVETAPRLVW